MELYLACHCMPCAPSLSKVQSSRDLRSTSSEANIIHAIVALMTLPEVPVRKLGSQGLQAAVMGLGCMGMSAFYTTGSHSGEEESIATIHRAKELGVTFLGKQIELSDILIEGFRLSPTCRGHVGQLNAHVCCSILPLLYAERHTKTTRVCMLLVCSRRRACSART